MKNTMMMMEVGFLTLFVALNGLMKNSAASNCVFLLSICNWVDISKNHDEDDSANCVASLEFVSVYGVLICVMFWS